MVTESCFVPSCTVYIFLSTDSTVRKSGLWAHTFDMRHGPATHCIFIKLSNSEIVSGGPREVNVKIMQISSKNTHFLVKNAGGFASGQKHKNSTNLISQ